jgi:hypothetical protein
VLVYVVLLASAARNAPVEVFLWTRAEATAAAWLGEHSTESDVVMASTELANPLVGSIDGRVVHGHIVATYASDAKKALVQRFYAAHASDSERREILRVTGASIVALGPRERALGASDLGLPELQAIYERDGVALYRVRS